MTQLAVLGGGNMAQALVLGAVGSGSLNQRDIVVADPDPVKREIFTQAGIEAFANFADTAPRVVPGTQVLLAVKPQVLPDTAADLAAAAGDAPRVFISVLAGTTGAGVRRTVGAHARVVRLMPNTPARIGRGITAITRSAGAEDGDDALARTLASSVGRVADLPEELFDAFTAAAGSGPAYVFYLAEAMRRGAERAGIDPGDADRIVRAVLTGAAALLDHDPGTPAEDLRAAVTSKGGTTAAAVRALDDAGVMRAVEDAVIAARDRGRELGS